MGSKRKIGRGIRNHDERSQIDMTMIPEHRKDQG